jgi:hypothetical protein
MTSADEVCEVIITAPDAEWLATFVRKLVDRKLCAAGQNVHPIHLSMEMAGRRRYGGTRGPAHAQVFGVERHDG